MWGRNQTSRYRKLRKFQIKTLKRSLLRHIIIKMSKIKDMERILKTAREKQLVTYKGSSITLSAQFSSENSEARRQWADIAKALKVSTKNLIAGKTVFQK